MLLLHVATLSGWREIGRVIKGQPVNGAAFGSLSDNKPDGKRELYLFGYWPGDEHASIIRCGTGVDLPLSEDGSVRLAVSAGKEVIKRLQPGERYEMQIRPDNAGSERHIRFECKEDE